MRCRPLALVLLTTVSALVGYLGLSGSAIARTRFPVGFFGMSLNPAITEPDAVSDIALDQQMGTMAATGVQTVRVNFAWRHLNPSKGHYDWDASDRLVAAAARNRLRVLPTVVLTPRWASANPKSKFYANYPPRRTGLYAQFMEHLVRRYGPHGSFFRKSSGVPDIPIRSWQIWNEPMQCFFWWSSPWWRVYVPMLKKAYRAVHKVDRHAVVVTAGLSGGPNVCRKGRPVKSKGSHPDWVDLRQLYRHGAKGSFDAIAINQYTNADGSRYTKGRATGVKASVNHLFQVAQYNRYEMRRAHDKPRQIYLTEFGWPAALGHLPKKSYIGPESTPAGAIKRTRTFYSRLARDRTFHVFDPTKGHLVRVHPRSLRITRAFYFTWATGFKQNPQRNAFAYSGLEKWVQGHAFHPLPILRAYRKVLRAFR